MVERPGRDEPAARRDVDDAAGAWSAAVRQQRRGFEPDLVAGRRRASEPDFPGAARSGKRPALLAPEGDREQTGAGRPLWRYLCGHAQIARGVSAMARADARRTRARRTAAPAVAGARLQAGARSLLYQGMTLG